MRPLCLRSRGHVLRCLRSGPWPRCIVDGSSGWSIVSLLCRLIWARLLLFRRRALLLRRLLLNGLLLHGLLLDGRLSLLLLLLLYVLLRSWRMGLLLLHGLLLERRLRLMLLHVLLLTRCLRIVLLLHGRLALWLSRCLWCDITAFRQPSSRCLGGR